MVGFRHVHALSIYLPSKGVWEIPVPFFISMTLRDSDVIAFIRSTEVRDFGWTNSEPDCH